MLVVALWCCWRSGYWPGRLVDGDTAEEVVVPGSDSAAANALLSSPDTFSRSRSELVLTAPAGQFVDSAELRTARDLARALGVPDTVPPVVPDDRLIVIETLDRPGGNLDGEQIVIGVDIAAEANLTGRVGGRTTVLYLEGDVPAGTYERVVDDDLAIGEQRRPRRRTQPSTPQAGGVLDAGFFYAATSVRHHRSASSPVGVLPGFPRPTRSRRASTVPAPRT